MRQFLLSASLLVALAPAAHAQAPVWTGGAQTLNPAPANDTQAAGQGIAADAAGNTVVVGQLASTGSGTPGTRAFGSTSLPATGFGVGFVAKLSASQQWQWATRATTTGEGISIDKVCLSPAGDVYVYGLERTDSFGGPPGGSTVTLGAFSFVTTDVVTPFVARLNAAGVPQWLLKLDQGVKGMAWDAAAGGLVLAGDYRGSTVRFGTTPTLPAAPDRGAFVARLSAAGQWTSAVGVAATAGTGTFTVRDAVVGPQGQVALTGEMENGSATFGSTTLTAATGTNDKLFAAQLSPAGTWQWAVISGGAQADGQGLAYTPSGDLWVIVNMRPGTQLGSTTTTGPAGTRSKVLARLSATGVWGAVIVQPQAITLRQVLSDAAGNGIVLGEMAGNGTLPQDYTSYNFQATGQRTAVARFSPAGVLQYALPSPAIGSGAAASNRYELGNSNAALDAAGNLYGTGSFRGGPLGLGSTTLTGSLYQNMTTNPSGGDVLVARLGNAGVLGVRQATGAPRLALFPNPAAAGTAVALRLPAPAAAARPLVLRDALGRTVYAGTLPAGQQQAALPTQGLAPGLYLLEAGPSRAQLVVE